MGAIIEIYTDGACSQNGTWEGGWGFYNITHKYGCMGYEIKTTNNRMELTAVIKALQAIILSEEFTRDQKLLKALDCNNIMEVKKVKIIIYTDSSYVANAYNKKWINNWKKNGWKNSKKETVKNKELWERLDSMVSKKEAFYTVEFVKVKGHSGILGNEMADKLATTAIEKKLKEPMLITIVDL